MLGKGLLWAAGLVFAVYGVACFVTPELPAGYAGLGIGSGDAYAEMAAMYGGLQFGFGLFLLLAALKPGFYRAALTLLVMAIGCLAVARLHAAWDTGWMVAGYTWGALAFEFAVAILAAIALRKP
ncbi:DUF4345 domain-containing protein [Seongchinamella sediminis]|uniref:DUF4345 domain-containing protein n=1 Tax=Seongchinamella sediminis TaxID=2283635 RepID=A0A3L7E467_9GAMM|nr:DUF4345 family protein [Seongchinamella sediminis]RLQ23192.1 DUF4345 domain-containing protein [Seongchinamella sediminis]